MIRFRGAVDKELLVRRRDTMEHRGPDSAGVWLSSDGCVGLAHRRLAIIDLSPSGHQPMVDANTASVITFNGEIYNFVALRERLRGLGQTFRTNGDTEVILAAYRQWGVDCVRELRGMFAFALYDPSAQRVLLARDRAGEKPLFYRHSADEFSFASETKALLADPGCSRRISAQSLNEFLAYGYVTGTNTMFSGIHRLAPGCSAVIDVRSGDVTQQTYWQIPSRTGSASPGAPVLVDEVHALLRDAVRGQLTADVPVGVLLSGGLDSSIVAAIASEVSSAPVRTFTARFHGHAKFDEGPYARLVANHLGTEHAELEIPAASADLLQALVRQFDEPIADSSMIPSFLLSREIRRHATVALGGDGGDELFGGYYRYPMHIRDERVRSRVPAFALRAASMLGNQVIPAGVPGRGRLSSLAGGLAVGIANAGRIFRSDERRGLSGAMATLSDSDLEAPEKLRMRLMAERSTSLQRATAVDFASYMVDDVLVKVDKASMLTSLEVRAPFLDQSVIEFAFSRVPDALRATETRRKILLQHLGSRLLPEALDLHRKQGFSIPVDDWMRGAWSSLLADAVNDAAPSVVSTAALRSYQGVLERGHSVGNQLFSLLFLRLWERHFQITDVV